MQKRLTPPKFFLLIAVFLGISTCFFLYQNSSRVVIFRAAARNDVEKVSEMLAAKPALINSTNLYGSSMLHVCVQNNSLDTMGFLLQNEATPVIRNYSPAEPIHLAARLGNVKALKLLVDHGAGIDSRGYRHRDTPLNIAVINRHKEAENYLLSVGANRMIQNTLGKSYYDLTSTPQVPD